MTPRLLSDAVLASRPAVTPAELAEACKAVAAMSDDEFFEAAVAIGLDPWSGMRRDRVTNERTWGTGRKPKASAA